MSLMGDRKFRFLIHEGWTDCKLYRTKVLTTLILTVSLALTSCVGKARPTAVMETPTAPPATKISEPDASDDNNNSDDDSGYLLTVYLHNEDYRPLDGRARICLLQDGKEVNVGETISTDAGDMYSSRVPLGKYTLVITWGASPPVDQYSSRTESSIQMAFLKEIEVRPHSPPLDILLPFGELYVEMLTKSGYKPKEEYQATVLYHVRTTGDNTVVSGSSVDSVYARTLIEGWYDVEIKYIKSTGEEWTPNEIYSVQVKPQKVTTLTVNLPFDYGTLGLVPTTQNGSFPRNPIQVVILDEDGKEVQLDEQSRSINGEANYSLEAGSYSVQLDYSVDGISLHTFEYPITILSQETITQAVELPFNEGLLLVECEQELGIQVTSQEGIVFEDTGISSSRRIRPLTLSLPEGSYVVSVETKQALPDVTIARDKVVTIQVSNAEIPTMTVSGAEEDQ